MVLPGQFPERDGMGARAACAVFPGVDLPESGEHPLELDEE